MEIFSNSVIEPQELRFASLKQFPAYLNRWDSQQARNEGARLDAETPDAGKPPYTIFQDVIAARCNNYPLYPISNLATKIILDLIGIPGPLSASLTAAIHVKSSVGKTFVHLLAQLSDTSPPGMNTQNCLNLASQVDAQVPGVIAEGGSALDNWGLLATDYAITKLPPNTPGNATCGWTRQQNSVLQFLTSHGARSPSLAHGASTPCYFE